MKNEHKNLDDPLVDILDNLGNPLLSMPLSMCIKQKLTREIAIVFITNLENQLIICKKKNTKSDKTQKLWDIPVYTDIYSNEFAEEAALRKLYEEFRISPSTINKIIRIPLNHNNNTVLANVFITKKIEFQEEKNTVYRQDKEIMYINLTELKSIISHSPELFAPQLIWAVQASWIN